MSAPFSQLESDLLSLGEFKLLEGAYEEALTLFEQVEKSYAPDFYRMGLSLFEYGSRQAGREEALQLATKKFRKASQLQSPTSELYHMWASAYALLGERLENQSYLYAAKEKYEKALKLSTETDLLWDYGCTLYLIGTYSEEAVDLYRAIQAFEKVKSDEMPAEFWVDLGSAHLLLSTKFKEQGHLLKAIDTLKKAVAQESHNFKGWSRLAEAYQTLYKGSHDEDHFVKANDCYSMALKLSPYEGELYFDWGQFLLFSAYLTREQKRVRSCIEKCHESYLFSKDHPHTLALWGAALAFLGELVDKADLLFEGENKVLEALDINDSDPDLWYYYGMCIKSFGAYFRESDYYHQAIEKFQVGVSMDRTSDLLWHEMANTYFLAGMLDNDVEGLKLSLKFYEKSMSLSPACSKQVDYARTVAKLGEIFQDQQLLESSLLYFETAIEAQNNLAYQHPEWLYAYASTLDHLGDFHEEENYYVRAIEIFSHIIMVDPDFPHIQHRIAQAFCHLGELTSDINHFYRAVHHLRLGLKRDEDNDYIILDWGITLINIAQHSPFLTDVAPLMQDAKEKLTLAAKMGNVVSYYHLSCLYSILREYEQAMAFLLKAEQYHALPPVEELLNDDWLDGLRSTSEFKEFLSTRPYLHKEI